MSAVHKRSTSHKVFEKMLRTEDQSITFEDLKAFFDQKGFGPVTRSRLLGQWKKEGFMIETRKFTLTEKGKSSILETLKRVEKHDDTGPNETPHDQEWT